MALPGKCVKCSIINAASIQAELRDYEKIHTARNTIAGDGIMNRTDSIHIEFPEKYVHKVE